MTIKVKNKLMKLLKEIGTIVLGISVTFYGLGILLFFDRALLMLSNVILLISKIDYILDFIFCWILFTCWIRKFDFIFRKKNKGFNCFYLWNDFDFYWI